MEKVKPPIWAHDEPGSTTSLGSISRACAALANIQPKVPRVWVTPFAGPVEPEVKKVAAGTWVQRGKRGVLRLRLHKFLKARLFALVTAIPDHTERQTPCLARGNVVRALHMRQDNLG